MLQRCEHCQTVANGLCQGCGGELELVETVAAGVPPTFERLSVPDKPPLSRAEAALRIVELYGGRNPHPADGSDTTSVLFETAVGILAKHLAVEP